MRPHEIQEKLGLTRIRDRNWYVQPACATTGDGLYEGLTWLTSNHKSWTGSCWWRSRFFPLFGKNNYITLLLLLLSIIFKKEAITREKFCHFKIRNLTTNSPFHSARVRKKKLNIVFCFLNWKILKEKE